MPRERTSLSTPSRILSRGALLNTWNSSRDSKKRAGAKGSDGVTARKFAANLDQNLRRISAQIAKGNNYFSRLRPFLIAKPGSNKERVICIPTIADRLIQRRVAFHLHHRKMLPIYNSSSFGFIPDIGVRDAISKVLEYRSQYDWCFETDIIGFFDRINRGELKALLHKKIGRSSLVNIIEQAIDLEIKLSANCTRSKLESLGIYQGLGIRQGMPLSPILSNLALSKFDRAVELRGISMVRYADDIVVFAESKKASIEAGNFIVEELAKLGHTVPEIGDESKTKIVSKFDPLTFLGRDIVFSDRDGRFVQKISKKKMETVLSFLKSMGDLDKLISEKISFSEFNMKIAQTVSSYVMAYRDASNVTHFENEMRRVAKESIRSIYSNIFGVQVVRTLPNNYEQFLGIDTLDISDMDIVDLF